MKKRPDNFWSEFNPLGVMVARLSFLLMVLGGAAAMLLLLTGSVIHSAARIELGVLMSAAVVGLYGWLRRNSRLAGVLESIGNFGKADMLGADFASLVHSWEDMQVKRGTADFDAWESLRLQREIECMAKEDPRLAEFWSDHQR